MEDNFLQCCNPVSTANQDKQTSHHIFLLIFAFQVNKQLGGRVYIIFTQAQRDTSMVK